MNNNKRHGKEYLNDFKLDKEGKYKYEGSIYKFDSKDKATLIKKLWIYTIIIDVLIVAAGCINTGKLSQTIYYVAPYCLQLVFAALLTYCVIKFNYHKKELREYQYEKSIARVKPYGSILLGLVIVEVIALIIYLLINTSGNAPVILIVIFALLAAEFIFSKLTIDLVEKSFKFTKKEGKIAKLANKKQEIKKIETKEEE